MLTAFDFIEDFVSLASDFSKIVKFATLIAYP